MECPESKKVVKVPSLYFVLNIAFILVLLALIHSQQLISSFYYSGVMKSIMGIVGPVDLFGLAKLLGVVLYISWVIINVAFIIFSLIKFEGRRLLMSITSLLSLASVPFLLLLGTIYYGNMETVDTIVAAVLIGCSTYFLYYTLRGFVFKRKITKQEIKKKEVKVIKKIEDSHFGYTKFIVLLIVGLFSVIGYFFGFLNTFFTAVLISIPVLFSLMCYLSVKSSISKRKTAKPKSIEKKEIEAKEIKTEPKRKETEVMLQRIENYRGVRKQRIVITLLGIFLIALVVFLIKTQIEKPSYPSYEPTYQSPSYEQPSIPTQEPSAPAYEPVCGNDICEYIENEETHRNCPTDCQIEIAENEIYGEYVTYDCPDELIPLCKKLQKRENDITYPFLKELMVDFGSDYCNKRLSLLLSPNEPILPIIVHVVEDLEGASGTASTNSIKLDKEELISSGEVGGPVIHEMTHVFDGCADSGLDAELIAVVVTVHMKHIAYYYQGIPPDAMFLDDVWESDFSKENLNYGYDPLWDPSEKELAVTYQFVDIGFFDKEFLKDYYSLLKKYPDSRSWENLANFIYQASGRREDIKEFFKEHGFSEIDFD